MIVKIMHRSNILHILIYFILTTLEISALTSCNLLNNPLWCLIRVSFYYHYHFYFEGYLDLKTMNTLQGDGRASEMICRMLCTCMAFWEECPKHSPCLQVMWQMALYTICSLGMSSASLRICCFNFPALIQCKTF